MHVYRRRLDDRLDAAEVTRFYRARLARIYPLYLFSLVCYLIFVGTLRGVGIGYEALSWGARFSTESWLTNLAMLQSLGIHKQLTWNMAAWSISTEFAVYLLFPLLLAALSHRAGRWTLLALAAGTFAFFYSINLSVNVTYDFGFLRCLSEVVFGMFLYQYGYQSSGRAPAISARTVYLLMAVIAGSLHLADSVIPDASVVAAFGLLIVSLANHRGDEFAWLQSPPLVWLGERSYSFYLNHFLAVELVYVLYSPTVSSRAAWHPSLMSGALFVLLVLGVNLAASALTYAYIEKPGRSWLKAGPRSRLGTT
jgi:peptidoglycan/LPS O-acetylase OafA/YrhL